MSGKKPHGGGALPPPQKRAKRLGSKRRRLAIDGVVYDLSDFSHPGGEAVLKQWAGQDGAVDEQSPFGSKPLEDQLPLHLGDL